MAILTMAILTMAILTMVILTMAWQGCIEATRAIIDRLSKTESVKIDLNWQVHPLTFAYTP